MGSHMAQYSRQVAMQRGGLLGRVPPTIERQCPGDFLVRLERQCEIDAEFGAGLRVGFVECFLARVSPSAFGHVAAHFPGCLGRLRILHLEGIGRMLRYPLPPPANDPVQPLDQVFPPRIEVNRTGALVEPNIEIVRGQSCGTA